MPHTSSKAFAISCCHCSGALYTSMLAGVHSLKFATSSLTSRVCARATKPRKTLTTKSLDFLNQVDETSKMRSELWAEGALQLRIDGGSDRARASHLDRSRYLLEGTTVLQHRRGYVESAIDLDAQV